VLLVASSALHHEEWGRTVRCGAGRLAGCWLSGLPSERDGINHECNANTDSQQPASLPAPRTSPSILTLRGVALTKQHSCSHYRYPRRAYFTGADLIFEPHFWGLGSWCDPVFPTSNWSLHHSLTHCYNNDIFFRYPAHLLGTIIDRKNVLPCNHLDIGALRLPTLAQNQTGDWLMPS